MNNPNPNRHRNTYLVLIAAGVFLLVGKWVGLMSFVGILLLLLGLQQIRSNEGSVKKGYIFVGAGAVLLMGGNISIIVALVLISLGLFYKKSKEIHRDGAYVQRQNFISSIRHDKEPWVLRSMSAWYVIGETRLDLSLALLEEKETTVVLQGVIGDLDIIVPEDLGVDVEVTVLVGQLDISTERASGVMNRIHWTSPNYETADNRVKLLLSYIVGDIDIKIM